MMMSEWVDLAGHQPSPEDWEAVNIVYTWHPAIPGVSDKARAKCLALYKANGYGIFHDMLPTAKQSCVYETNIWHAAQDLARETERYATMIRALQARRDRELGLIKARIATSQNARDELKARYRHD